MSSRQWTGGVGPRYWDRELLPADMLPDMDKAKVVITNYHAFKQRERMQVSKGTRAALEGWRGGQQRAAELASAGYPLATAALQPQCLIEVYPHPALLALTKSDYRLPYKQDKIRKYWRTLTPKERREKLLAVWDSIVMALDEEIERTAKMLALPSADAPIYALKAFEDALDAVICAWVGVCALEGRAEPCRPSRRCLCLGPASADRGAPEDRCDPDRRGARGGRGNFGDSAHFCRAAAGSSV